MAAAGRAGAGRGGALSAAPCARERRAPQAVRPRPTLCPPTRDCAQPRGHVAPRMTRPRAGRLAGQVVPVCSARRAGRGRAARAGGGGGAGEAARTAPRAAPRAREQRLAGRLRAGRALAAATLAPRWHARLRCLQLQTPRCLATADNAKAPARLLRACPDQPLRGRAPPQRLRGA